MITHRSCFIAPPRLQGLASLQGDDLCLAAALACFLHQPFQLASDLGANPVSSTLTTYGGRHVADNNDAKAKIHTVCRSASGFSPTTDRAETACPRLSHVPFLLLRKIGRIWRDIKHGRPSFR